MTIAAAVALATIGHSVQATLIIDTGTGTLENSDNELLTVNYEVSYDSGSGKYTYDYNLEASAGLTSFTLSAYTPTVELGTDGIGALSALIYPNSIEWQWGPPYFGQPLSDTQSVNFTSDFGPGYSGWNVDSTDDSWINPPNLPSPSALPPPTAVPEASTFLAGGFMLLPLGIGIFRRLHKPILID